MEFFDYVEPETISNFIISMSIGVVIMYIWAAVRNRREAASVPVKAKIRIDKLKAMGEPDALAELIANETDTYICRLAAEALVELGDGRGEKLLDSPRGETLTSIPKPAKYGLGLRLLAAIVVFFITWIVLWALFIFPVISSPLLYHLSNNPFIVALFWATPLIAGYIAYRLGWRNKIFIKK